MRCRAPSEAAREREAVEEEVEAAVARRRACGGARGRLVPLVTLRLKIEATAASTGLRCAAGTTLPNPIPYKPIPSGTLVPPQRVQLSSSSAAPLLSARVNDPTECAGSVQGRAADG